MAGAFELPKLAIVKETIMAKDMTKGQITSQLILFTIPLILGNLFQLTYNAADSVIVGKFLGDTALAAVGTAGPVMNLVILFFSGMCMGAGILMSTLYGAKDYEKLEKQISTALIGGLVLSFLITFFMFLFATPVLKLMRVPEEVLPGASGYLRIIFAGLVFTFIYNFLSNTLRALGDSKTPLYFLTISAVLNIILDLLFVVGFKWGVNGSALATVLSGALCCVFCAIHIKRNVPVLCLGKKWCVFEKSLLMKTFSYGITSALQLMCVQLGKLFVQSMVNARGISFMAAFAATNRVDDFALTPQQNIAHATTTFMAQNKGAKQTKRMKQGFLHGTLIQLVYTTVTLLVVFFFAKPIIQLFLSKDSIEALEFAVTYIQIIALMYLISGTTNILQGFFRGTGDLKITLISSLVNIITRVIVTFFFLNVMHAGFGSLAWANGIGWIAMFLLEFPLLLHYWKKLK